MRRFGYINILWFTIVCYCSSLYGEHLAVKNFSITEGLARNQVSTIYADSRGFIWIGTADGLSLFDGYGFRNYNLQNGLPHPVISGIAEAENGVYWIATQGGLCLVDFNVPLSEDRKLFLQPVKLGNSDNPTVFSIFLDSRKQLWAGTREGLYKIRRENNDFITERISLGDKYLPRREGIGNFTEDLNQNLWISSPDGLFRIEPSLKVTRYSVASNDYFDRLGNISVDNEGRLWIGGLDGLYVLKPTVANENLQRINQPTNRITLPQNPGEFTFFDEKSGLVDKKVLEIFHSSDKQLWIATRKGISLFDGQSFKNFTAENGLFSDEIMCFDEDSTGNIWIGTESTGVMRVAQNGFTTYTVADGLIDNRISSVFEGSKGEIYVIDGRKNISRFENNRFLSVKPNFPSQVTQFGWSWQKPVLEDKQNGWWFATAQGLVRFPEVRRVEELSAVSPIGFYTASDGLAGNQIYRLFEDRTGNIWISNFAPPNAGITKWERASGIFHKVTDKNLENLSAYSFAEDNFGNLWLGLSNGHLARIIGDKIQTLENIENLPKSIIYDMLLDKNGSLWLATGSGAYLAENLAAEIPSITPLTANEGLATNDIIALTDDLQGRIYLATSQGIHRYHPQTKRIELFTTADGLANSELRTATRSRNGNLWFGTIRGLTRFEPQKLKEINHPAPVIIRSVNFGGKTLPISELGAENIAGAKIPANQNHIEIEIVGLSLNSGDILKYQYKLDEGENWSEPLTQRKFTLVNLQPGDYQFQARVINTRGLISQSTAKVTFTVLAPFYKRWWFWLTITLAIAVLAYFFYRSRIKRLTELEKVRHSIATDLHDDIGSSLSQISLISEVLSLKGNGNNDDKKSLETIAETSREAVEAMSEMVWAINPRSDNLASTIQRMRRFAIDTLNSADIRPVFQISDFNKQVGIGVDIRRHIYLIYKEIINNIAKHSEATEVFVNITESGDNLIISISDNGKGFNEKEIEAGNGLANMRSRAEKIGGALQISSEKGKGTMIKLQTPIRLSIFSKFST